MRKKKLRLHRETIRLLDPDQLGAAAGADCGTNTCDTHTCVNNCQWSVAYSTCACDTGCCWDDSTITRPQSICQSCGAGC